MAADRLAKEDWVKAGLAALARDGVGGLKADVLAKALGVSRGSFYWHFPDVDGFQAAVLASWERRATLDTIDAVEKDGGEPADKLHRLSRLVFSGDGALERQVRAWATQQKSAATVQTRVDRQRIRYVKALLEGAGHRPAAADARARFVYLTLIGLFSTARRVSLEADELRDMVDLVIRT